MRPWLIKGISIVVLVSLLLHFSHPFAYAKRKSNLGPFLLSTASSLFFNNIVYANAITSPNIFLEGIKNYAISYGLNTAFRYMGGEIRGVEEYANRFYNRFSCW